MSQVQNLSYFSNAMILSRECVHVNGTVGKATALCESGSVVSLRRSEYALLLLLSLSNQHRPRAPQLKLDGNIDELSICLVLGRVNSSDAA